jgi:arginyl-tRNA synthetase
MEETIRKAVQSALDEVGTRERNDSRAVRFAVEWPTDIAHGDFATNVALAAAKPFSMSPQDLAGDLLPRIQEKLGTIASSVSIAGPGFINITLSREYLAEQIRVASALGDEYGKGTANNEKRIVIEYSCPNPFKEMHIGHLMSTVIGEAVSRVVENSGATVIRDSYGGDVGPHVAKALWALQKKEITQPTSAKEIGEAYAHGSRAYEESEEAKKEIDELNVALYVALVKEQSDLSQGERSLLDLWRIGREVALEEFREIYRVLDTHFDYFIFESETTSIGLDVVQDGLARGVFEESDGAVIYRGEKKGFHTLVFITSRGTPTYEAKDVGLAFLKEEKIPNDESYILTAAEQVGHFNVFLAALEDIAPLIAKKTTHVPHGFLRLTTGKMSSREGNVITAEEIIKEVIAKAQEKNEDPIVAEQVAVGALKYMILRASPGSDIIFDPEKSLSLEGDSGPYLQYATVRAKSVLAQAEPAGEGKANTELPSEPYLLERLLIRFPEVAARAEADRAPHHITTYLIQLAGEWNSFYAKERIIGGEYESYKLELAKAFVQTMTNGLKLLAIPVPEKM